MGEVTWVDDFTCLLRSAVLGHFDVVASLSAQVRELVREVKAMMIVSALISQDEEIRLWQDREGVHGVGPHDWLDDLGERDQEALMHDRLGDAVRIGDHFTFIRLLLVASLLHSGFFLREVDPWVVVLLKLLEKIVA